MRWHLLKSFDKICVIDLHGNAKKKEVGPDASQDKNVFDIQQGVALIIALKRKDTKRPGELASLRHADAWGSRESKNEVLWSNDLKKIRFTKLAHQAPQYPFVPRDHGVEESYKRGISLADLMPLNSAGILTARDALSIDLSREDLWKRISRLVEAKVETFRKEFSVGDDSKSWSLAAAKKDAANNLKRANIKPIVLRPFEVRHTFFTGNQGGIQFFPAPKTMLQLARHDNLSFLSCRQTKERGGAFVTEHISAHKSFSAYDISSVFPLYVYPAESELNSRRRANFLPKLYTAICKAARIDPAKRAGSEEDFRAATGESRPSEVKVFDYIYGVLHSPAYRETFAEFLKIDFPRIPYPPSPQVFAHVSEKGEQLRRLHLMEAPAIGDTPYPYTGDGDDVVASGFPKLEEGRVLINKTQGFDAVPPVAWTFHIGGYQPAQKWLKDRRGRALSWDDIGHYQKIVKILVETDRVMKEIVLPLT